MKFFKLFIAILLSFGYAICFSVDSRSQVSDGEKIVYQEAPVGIDDITNGHVSQEFFNKGIGLFRKHFIDREGLGPIFNGEMCTRCHQFPTIGGSGLIMVIRAGIFDGKNFKSPIDGTVIQTNAIPPQIRKTVQPDFNVVTNRMPTSMLGDGFIEAIDDSTIRAIAAEQPKISKGKIAGEIIEVPVIESPGKTRVGRFGWKNSHASIFSFVAEALRNELGVTSEFYPNEISFFGKSVAEFDRAKDPEIDKSKINLIADFIRSTKSPENYSKKIKSSEMLEGDKIFTSIGCAICHVPTIKTAAVGTVINGGAFKVTDALGNKIVHPYSDFLLHDVGTGDGILETNNPSSRNKIRTAPLWGIGARLEKLKDNLLWLHNGSAKNLTEAILKHRGEAATVTEGFQKLPEEKKRLLMKFLESL
ncbi:MAG: di-heme oxidoredictase family protein [Acidobacteriota bacterium]